MLVPQKTLGMKDELGFREGCGGKGAQLFRQLSSDRRAGRHNPDPHCLPFETAARLP
jgi:hypothetical protein